MTRAMALVLLTIFVSIPDASRGQTYSVAPAWQPIGPARAVASPQGVVTHSPVNVANPSPYSGVAPIYQSGGMMTTFLPQTVASSVASIPMPAATISTGRQTIVPDQMMTPMVQTSNGLVAGTPGVVTPIPAPAVDQQFPMVAPSQATVSVVPPTTSVFPTMTPPYAPVATPAPQVAQTPMPTNPPANPINPLPATPAVPASQPLADPNVFVSGGQEWMDIDLTPYTRDFPEGSGAERSVREWIVRKFDPSTWTGNQVSSLVVTPSHVKVYHTPAVQKSVCDLLVRFLYYKPGTFQSQVRVVATRDTRWLNKYQSVLLPAGQNGTNGRLWLVRGEDARDMITDLGGGTSGSLLANPDAVVVNGQHVTVDWSPRAGQKADPNNSGKPSQDGVLVTFSPLIDVDAATVELDLSAAVRRTVEARSGWGINRSEYRPDVFEENVRDLVKIPPGQVVLASLGRVPDFDGGRNIWGRERTADILVFIVCQPSPGNMVSGRPVDVTQSFAPSQRTMAARPVGNASPETGLSKSSEDRSQLATRRGPAEHSSRRLPPELTMSVD
jgi:hypothetical protein